MIVQVQVPGTTVAVTWSASISLAHATTTNNQAEYRGVLTGLSAAYAHQWIPLEVVGDSALILRQLEHYRPPKNLRLLQLYAAARRLADRLGVTRWHHHLRNNNKMADHVANVATDRCDSIQILHPATRPEHDHLQHLLHGDFQHWQDAAYERLAQVG